MIITYFTFALMLAFINVTNCLVFGQAQLSLNNFMVSQSQTPAADTKKPAADTKKPATDTKKPATDIQTPPVDDRPGQRKPTGTRGSCEDKEGVAFTPLLPLPDPEFSASTITGYPTFWFYVPYSSKAVSDGRFSLEDAEGNRIYKLDFRLPEHPGIVSVQLPKEEKPLEVNKTYRWYFRLYCSSQESSEESSERNWVYHTGLVQRVAQEKLDAQLQVAKIENRAAIYIANQLWYDMPDLAQIRSRPNDWMNILKALELEELKEEKITGSVLPR
ncbi:DUF928 domain-containing protein [Kamptonema sp. UHCC 0994]|uniref:DUF928 domain-containing protein n=1 Tax=Kamptonema sp. UHCC 0994 TaxID=3031329 RepID=UPI0023BA348A|nr:DUF928 domain-containing protein [Kamptonema sp. UHCC 0994]MDF0552581.1 DUF928 domain-containing protein [Kamptonema sp. UHCC 0994]